MGTEENTGGVEGTTKGAAAPAQPMHVVWPISLLLVAVVVGAVGATAYHLGVKTFPKPPEPARMLTVMGLSNPVTNRLDARFTDADGDMVADAPDDPARLVDPDVLLFSYIANPDPQHYAQVFRPLMEHLSARTGKKTKYVLFDSWNEQLKALRDGAVHVTAFSTGAVPVAVNACGFVPVCAPGSAEGLTAYRMNLITWKDSPISRVEDLRGRTLAVTTPSSNSGFKAPVVLLMSDFGLNPGRDYQVVYSYGHRKSIQGVLAKKFELAAVASDLLAREAAQDPDNVAGKYRVVFESEPFPPGATGYAHNLAPDLAAGIREALLDFSWTGTTVAEEFGAVGSDRFVPVSYKDQWGLIRRIDDAIGQQHILD